MSTDTWNSESDVDVALQQLGTDLHALLERVDPARLRADSRQAAVEALRALAASAQRLRPQLQRAAVDVAPTIDAACADLVAAHAEVEAGADLARVRGRLTAAYDALGRALRRRTLAAPRNRPTNYLRNLYHIGNGVGILLLIEVLVNRTGMLTVAASFAAFAWTAELTRRRWPVVNSALMRGFGTVAHPDEHWTINSATWMVTALLVVAFLCPLPACAVAVAVLGFGDPAAALVGRRFGRVRLRGSKTLEGTLGFAVVATAGAAVTLTLFHPELPLTRALAVAAVGALPAALAELWAGDWTLAGRRWHIDDNLVVPLTAALGASIALAM